MKFQLFVACLFAAATTAVPLGGRGNTVNSPPLPTIPEEKRHEEARGAEKWPSLPTIVERKRHEEADGAAKWPSLPSIAEK